MKKRAEKENAYLTVEAALVFPIVLVIQCLTIFLFVFQYDRCLLNQDMERLVVLGCGSEEEEKDALANELKRHAGELSLEKYVAWEMEAVEIGLEKDGICVQGQGKPLFPVLGFGMDEGRFAGTISASCESKRIHPAMFIRQCRRLKGEE